MSDDGWSATVLGRSDIRRHAGYEIISRLSTSHAAATEDGRTPLKRPAVTGYRASTVLSVGNAIARPVGGHWAREGWRRRDRGDGEGAKPVSRGPAGNSPSDRCR